MMLLWSRTQCNKILLICKNNWKKKTRDIESQKLQKMKSQNIIWNDVGKMIIISSINYSNFFPSANQLNIASFNFIHVIDILQKTIFFFQLPLAPSTLLSNVRINSFLVLSCPNDVTELFYLSYQTVSDGALLLPEWDPFPLFWAAESASDSASIIRSSRGRAWALG